MRAALLIVDPQHDFCDPAGALFVPGAPEDMRRLAAMVRRMGASLRQVHVTLDSHHPVHIAHPIFWKDPRGEHPAPFTSISVEDVERGAWGAARPELQEHCRDYVRALARHGRYPLVIWPPHCLIGGRGHAVVPELHAALVDWEQRGFAVVDYVIKGSSILTEHYSALRADVPVPDDPATHLNAPLVEALLTADVVGIAGEAGSHCVANTVRDLAEAGGPGAAKKLVLLTDATSPVPGFEPLQEAFLEEMKVRGMRTSTTRDGIC